MSKIQPLADRVLVRALEAEDKTASGIVLPDSAKEKPQEAEVVAVGPGKVVDGKRQALEVKVGDKVIVSKYGGDEIKVGGEELKLVAENDILAIVK